MRKTLTNWLTQDREKKIFLLRHGSLEIADDEKRFIGQTDLPLSERGRRQAKLWSRQLTDLPLDRIYCSDLQRCRETASQVDLNVQERQANVADAFVADQALDIQMLKEINKGNW